MNNFLIFGLSLIFLGLAANLLVKFTEGFASRAKLSPLVLGATAIALGTSIPELSVSLSSLLQGVPSLSLGDMIGSNIANISLILGISIVIFPIRVGTEKTQRNNVLLILLTYFFVILYVLPIPLRKLMSLGLLVFYFVFLTLELFWGVTGSKKEDKKALKKMKRSKLSSFANLTGIATSLVTLGISSKFLVTSAVAIARNLSFENEVVGLTMVAVGTSLPELLTSIVAGLKKDWKLLFGDVQGSNIFNLSIIGTLLTLFGGNGGHAHTISLIYLATVTIIMFILTLRFMGKVIPRKFGLLFLLTYASYIFLITR
jgi:cation:H+ antiporter